MTNHPHFLRRYNWFLVAREWRIMRKLHLLLIALLIGIILYLGNGWALEHLAHTDAIHAHRALTADVYRLANLGEPGWIRSDFTDGTVDFEVRKP